ncbi:MAG: hypothetical protein IJW79_09595 [Clostridia bacterium]|nr:hypothetical protein [Clostridia bacterium]
MSKFEKNSEKEKIFSKIRKFFQKPLYKSQKMWYNALEREKEECIWIISKE